MSSAYHPQSDGQTKVVNWCVEQYLWCLYSQYPHTWELTLAWAKFLYNTTFHVVAEMTPFQALYGWVLPNIVHYMESTSVVDKVNNSLAQSDLLH